MLAQIRQKRILVILQEAPAVIVRDLAIKLEVSESTIRRDLNEMEALDLVKRVHGAAMINPKAAQEPPFEIRQITHRENKASAGYAAASLVHDGMIVFIDGGTTTPFIVRHLKNRQHLTIVTVGHNVMNELAQIPTISSIVIGGEYHLETQVFAGHLSLRFLDSCGLNFDLALISAVGVSAKAGATNQILDRIPQKQKAIEHSDKTAIVVDGSKIGQIALGHIIRMQAADYLVSDVSAIGDELDAIADLGPKIVLADGKGLVPKP
jgi:DeoR family transcriptional regulator, fructose operon transcriptional repressor